MPRITSTTTAGSNAPTSPSPVRAAGIVKHSLLIAGHRTSISLEDVFWRALRREAARRGLSVAELVVEIDAGRGASNLSSAIRVHLFEAAEAGANQAGDDVS